MPINIRKATVADMPAIHQLVKVLASFEKEENSVTVDAEYYAECFLSKVFNVLVAEDEGKVVGMTLYYLTFSTWKGRMMYLEDFVVLPEYRNRGVGKLLWDSWIADSKKQGVKMVKWQVLDWNTDATRFYEREGATIEKQWWNGKIIF